MVWWLPLLLVSLLSVYSFVCVVLCVLWYWVSLVGALYGGLCLFFFVLSGAGSPLLVYCTLCFYQFRFVLFSHVFVRVIVLLYVGVWDGEFLFEGRQGSIPRRSW